MDQVNVDNMEIHYKSTVWNKITIPDEIDKEDIIKQLNEGILPTELDLDNNFDSEYEVIYETEEFITPEENDGQSTIELMDYVDGKNYLSSIWDNSYESEIKRKQ